jgi:hypothetical protein
MEHGTSSDPFSRGARTAYARRSGGAKRLRYRCEAFRFRCFSTNASYFR